MQISNERYNQLSKSLSLKEMKQFTTEVTDILVRKAEGQVSSSGCLHRVGRWEDISDGSHFIYQNNGITNYIVVPVVFESVEDANNFCRDYLGEVKPKS